MNALIQTINPTFVEHEGMLYLEFEGGFYKGCRRCGGQGHYSHNGDHSRCYECDNTSAKLGDYISDNREDAEKWCHVRALAKANRERKANAKAQAARDARDARVEALKVTDADVVTMLQKIYDDENEAYQTGDYSKVSKSEFLRDMASKLFNASGKDLSENMLVALRKVVAREAEKAVAQAALPALVEGRREVVGKVVSTKTVEGDYGTSYKMLVELADGTRIFGSIPNNLWNEVEFLGAYRKSAWNETDGVMTKLVGMELKFTATIEASKNDKSFGFFKRPAKAEIVA
ncbi:hypothetical protein SEA_RIKSENGUPTA_41 [Microbacterium phage RikSengupta]|nr:hypothetical protein SEA_RIKSENGUPTA_41 [Microbacterium phage RikSengupta]